MVAVAKQQHVQQQQEYIDRQSKNNPMSYTVLRLVTFMENIHNCLHGRGFAHM